MKHPRSGFAAPPQGGAASGPAKPVPRRPLGLLGSFIVAALATGCAAPQPWVKPYERELLADPIMRGSAQHALAAKHSAHVRDIREGARGATGVQGGGCGCK